MSSNILSEVIQMRDAVTGGECRDLLYTVGAKLIQLKTDIVESVQSAFLIYESDIDKVTSWYVEILGLQEKLEDLRAKFNDDRQALRCASDDIDCLEDELARCDKGISLLNTLVQVVRNVEKADPHEYYKASILARTAEEDFAAVLSTFDSYEDRPWIVGVRSMISDLVTDVYEVASTELRAVFHFHLGKNTLTIKRRPEIRELVDALINIDHWPRVVQKMAGDIWQELLVKACSQDYNIEVNVVNNAVVLVPSNPTPKLQKVKVKMEKAGASRGRKEDNNGTGDDILSSNLRSVGSPNPKTSTIIVRAVATEHPISHIEAVFENIYRVLSVFFEVFEKDAEIMSQFAEILGPRICDELGRSCLKNLILRSAQGDASKARANIALMNRLIGDFSANLNFTFPDNTILDDLENDFDSQFVSQVKQDLLIEVRKLIRSNLLDTKEVQCIVTGNPNDEAGSKPSIISKSIKRLVDLLKDYVQKYSDDIGVCDAVFNLYLSLNTIPRFEGDTGDLTPLGAVLIMNNSLYLAGHAAATFPISDDKVLELRAKATQAHSFLLRSSRTKLNYLISDAMAIIMSCETELSNSDMAKFLKISDEFTRLKGMLEFALPPPILHRCLSTLVDHTVNELCGKVTMWDDISAVCANNLAAAFSQFALDALDLFKGNARDSREIEAITSKCVSKWNRFRQLTFILTASMKDIQDRWVGGCGPIGAEFKPDELRKLVRALFQNTDRRAAFLATIK